MAFNSGKRAEDIDDIYAAICGVLDETPQPSRELYLARLCLLLVGELDQKDRVMALIEQARVSA